MKRIRLRKRQDTKIPIRHVDLLPVTIDLLPEFKSPEDGSTGDEEFGLPEMLAEALAPSEAELVVADDGGVFGERDAVGGEFRREVARGEVGFGGGVAGGVAGYAPVEGRSG